MLVFNKSSTNSRNRIEHISLLLKSMYMILIYRNSSIPSKNVWDFYQWLQLRNECNCFYRIYSHIIDGEWKINWNRMLMILIELKNGNCGECVLSRKSHYFLDGLSVSLNLVDSRLFSYDIFFLLPLILDLNICSCNTIHTRHRI